MKRSFAEAFATLQADHAPFPWQQALFDRFVAGNLPDCLDIPTGLGKTSIMAIWLLARETNTSLPRRLVYVVNRRTIVDQATEIAKGLRNHDRFRTLAISTLRGALADNSEWMERPHEPAIIIGTIDMIGSRLLFDAYRAGRWTKAMHAGLLGQDTLIVHDESHLSRPFQKLMMWIQERQKNGKDGSPKPLRVIAMSATDKLEGADCHALTDDDHTLPIVKQRIHSVKRLRVHPYDAKTKLVETMAALAFSHEGEGEHARRIILYVKSPATAQQLVDRLTGQHKVDGERVALLTGTIRGHERDCLVESAPLRALLKPGTPLDKTVYLVSTSAGEVGADFDAHHLICDLTTLDNMIQRLGRVNRRGDNDSKVDVFVDVKDPKKTLCEQMLRTAERLNTLPVIPDDPDGRRDASPNALTTQRERDKTAYDAAISPPPEMITPHPATLDAWALTSIQDEWPIAPPLEEYLHGRTEWEPLQTSVAWREEIEIFFPPQPTEDAPGPAYDFQERLKQFRKWIELCPLRPREVLSEKTDAVVDLLRTIASKDDGQFAERIFVRIQRHDTVFEKFEDFINRFDKLGQQAQARLMKELSEETLILPCDVGGLTEKGMIDENTQKRVLDVADQTLTPEEAADEVRRKALQSEHRVRVWIEQDADDSTYAARWFVDALGPMPEPHADHDLTKWVTWRDELLLKAEALQGLNPVPVLRLSNDAGVAGYLLLYRPKIEQKQEKARLLLDKHNEDVHEQVNEYLRSPLTFGEPCIPRAIALAAKLHDLGKAPEWWQASISNHDLDKPLAKSFGKGMRVESLDGYRHEFGSALAVVKKNGDHRAALNALAEEERDLVLHLIVAHHGRGRPIFPAGAIDPSDRGNTTFDDLITPAAIARRYAKLQRRFGHWGLAWIESLLKCADHAASRDVPEDQS